MIALLQRVTQAGVTINQERVATIGKGLLVLICAERGDTIKAAQSLVDRLLGYRVFGDEAGRMNLSLATVQGELLLVPQFTLAADTHSGTRPSFTPAAPPDEARALFDSALEHARLRHSKVQSGVFGADMQVSLVNDGPVTFWLDTH